MIHIHDKEVNTIAECNLLHDIINTSKCYNNTNTYLSPIIHGFMNTHMGRRKK